MKWLSSAMAVIGISCTPLGTVSAFSVSGGPRSTCSRASALCMARRRGGSYLREIVSDDANTNTNTNTKQVQKGTEKPSSLLKKKKSSSGTSATSGTLAVSGVSPSLAEWASQNAATTTTTTTSSVSTDPPSSKRKTSERRSRQAERLREESVQRARIRDLSMQLQALFEAPDETSNKSQKSQQLDIDQILALVDEVEACSDITVSSFRQALTVSSSTSSSSTGDKNYRLLWAGSDEAVCHLGTGLHKVPLARLQEVFFCAVGQSTSSTSSSSSSSQPRIEMYEVIRILGPFPNVKNTLKGTLALTSGDKAAAKATVTYDSMIDGTGKEILAGREDNVRTVPLSVVHASEELLVWRVPSSTYDDDDDNANAKAPDGSDLLIFVREENMDTKLEQLRVG